jgi:hypothetical protein
MFVNAVDQGAVKIEEDRWQIVIRPLRRPPDEDEPGERAFGERFRLAKRNPVRRLKNVYPTPLSRSLVGEKHPEVVADLE